MRRAWLGLFLVTGCIPVTVNLNFNFPQKELEEKFLEMEKMIQYEGMNQAGPPPDGMGDAGAFDPVPEQEGKVDINVNSPAIEAINKRRIERYPALYAHFKAGRVGETRQGIVGVRDDAGLAGREKAEFLKVLKGENEDRETLFKEVLRANKLAEDQLPNVRKAFARARYRALEVDLWFQTVKGEWRRKTGEDNKTLDAGGDPE